MKFTIKKIWSITTIVVLVFAFSACSNHKEGDGHDHGTKKKNQKKKKLTKKKLQPLPHLPKSK